MKVISGNIVDVLNSEIYPGTIGITDGRISSIAKEDRGYENFIIPPLVDSHIHIESSMMVPSEFARLAVRHGTVAVVSDPHEIANVLGLEGVRFMIRNGKGVPFKFYFGAPSCVPATGFETSGAELGTEEIEELLKETDIRYLSEMMNFPAVLDRQPGVMAKIELTQRYGKRIDGHAPGLRGDALKRYIEAGITTDHETLGYEEGLEKLRMGMKLQIREGSAVRNFDELIPLIEDYPDDCMFCSDDKHPDDLAAGHINELVRRALGMGYDRMKVLQCASVNPVRHYKLDVGLLQRGDYADFIVIDNLDDFNILSTCINGEVVYEGNRSFLPEVPVEAPNKFRAKTKAISAFEVKMSGERIRVIEAIDGQIMTRSISGRPKTSGGFVVSDRDRDILKIAVVNRYVDTAPSVAFVRGFGLKRGAIATSVCHDSHNIIVVGVSDRDIQQAVNLIVEKKGGLSAANGGMQKVLPLPVAGLMSCRDGTVIAGEYVEMDRLAKELGSGLSAPYMTLSFMSLLVIPELKLGDRGLFDGTRFEFVDLFIDGG